MFFINIAINVSMNLGTFPIIGITLPFLSYGGSSLLITLISIGIVLNVNKKMHKNLEKTFKRL